MTEMNLRNRNRLTAIENKLMVTKEERRWGRDEPADTNYDVDRKTAKSYCTAQGAVVCILCVRVYSVT